MKGNQLKGVLKRGETVTAQIAGVRAPELKRKAAKAWTDPEPLFNGKDLAGWEPFPDSAPNNWVAEDGVLLNKEHGANLKTTHKFGDTPSIEPVASTSSLLLRHGNRDIAVLHPAGMIALQIERSRFAFVGIESAAGDSRHLLVVHRFDAVANDGQVTPQQRDVKGFPLARWPGQLNRRSDEAVDSAHTVELLVRAGLLICNLNLIAATEKDAAVAAVGAVVLDVHARYTHRVLAPTRQTP